MQPRKPVNPKYIRIVGIIVAIILLIFIVIGYIAYSKRAEFLQKELTKAEIKAKEDYDLDIKIGSANFTGLSTVSFSDISIVPDNRDSLLSIKTLTVEVKVLPLIWGNVKFGNVSLDDASSQPDRR